MGSGAGTFVENQGGGEEVEKYSLQPEMEQTLEIRSRERQGG